MMRKMKTMLAAMLIMMLAFANIAAAQAYLPGTYEGQGQGFGGAVKVTITVDENAITSVTAEGAQETEGLGDLALPKLAQQILDAQSAEIDGVAGATMTSGGAKEAAAKAIASAKGEAAEAAASLIPGTYTAAKEGFQHGYVTVSVTVDEKSILDVQIVEVTDHPLTVVAAPCEQIPAAIVERQSYNVDVVTGATLTSNAIKNAVRDCLEQAGGADAFSAAPEKAELVQGEDVHTDILVVGGGAAGMIAALEANAGENLGEKSGLNVMLVEKAGFLGGNTSVSGGVYLIHEDETGAYDQAWIDRTVEAEKAVIGQYMQTPFNEALVRGKMGVLKRTNELMDHVGVKRAPAWGNLVFLPTEHEEVKWHGSYLTHVVNGYLPDTGIDLRLSTAATRLITDEKGAVIGAQVQDKTSVYNVYAKKVILATGGFANNKELVAKYAPTFKDTPRFSAGTTTGDGFVMATELGAGTVGSNLMGHIGADDIVGIRPDYSLTFGFGMGLFMGVNPNGERFCDESMSRYEMYHKVLLQGTDTCWGIVDSDNANVQALAESQSGLVVSADTLEELAEKLGMPAETLVKTAETYNTYVDGGKDDAFGCPVEMMDRVSVGPYYAWPVHACGITSLVALTVDGSCRVLTEQGEVIENLYATGDLVMGNLVSYYVVARGVGTAVYSGNLAAQTAKAEIFGK